MTTPLNDSLVKSCPNSQLYKYLFVELNNKNKYLEIKIETTLVQINKLYDCLEKK